MSFFLYLKIESPRALAYHQFPTQMVNISGHTPCSDRPSNNVHQNIQQNQSMGHRPHIAKPTNKV